jgi:hypothetical protein
LYFSKHQLQVLDLNNFEFYFESKVSQDDDKQQRIIFRNKNENSMIGEIIPKHFIWNEQILTLKAALSELHAYKGKSRERQSKVPGISWLFGSK